METGFFAYPDNHPHISEIIEETIMQLKQSNSADIISWKELKTSGKFIPGEIFNAIKTRDVFCCDLTHLNSNVLFELGFAIAKNKKIWITLDPNTNKAKENYTNLRIATVGYTPYSNIHELLNGFESKSPFNDKGYVTIYDQVVAPLKENIELSKFFYLKSPIPTEASIRLTNLVEKIPLTTLTDDPSEIPTQPFSWYIKSLFQSCGMIVHFVADEHEGSELLNSQYSLISGLAHGLEIPLLMLAHAPYKCPLDYLDNLKIHSTASECEAIGQEWIEELELTINERKDKLRIYRTKVKHQLGLQNIYLGDSIAENETDKLNEYFIETGGYRTALEAKQTIFIGKKGTGKTANLFRLAQELTEDKRNHVCIIMPPTYDMQGIYQILEKTLNISERGYLIESLWKFLIYSELARSYYFELIRKIPSSLQEIETEFINYMEQNEELLLDEFSQRLNKAIEKLQNFLENQCSDSVNNRLRISELLHDNVLKYLRSKLGDLLTKKNKVCILIDNLDKSWDTRNDLTLLGEFLFALLGVSRRIEEDFKGKDNWRKSIKLSLIIFIRSDIFYEIYKTLREPDKMSYFTLKWDDPLLLQRIIETRFKYADKQLTDDLWDRYFCPSVKGIDTKNYLTDAIFPRPRDIIYLCSSSLSEAVNRGHSKIEEEDIMAAEVQYSQYALSSLVAENPLLKDLYDEFLARPCIITHNQIIEMIKEKNVNFADPETIISLLCSNGFLGQEVNNNLFEFVTDEQIQHKVDIKSNRLLNSGTPKRYCINRPFFPYLEIEGIEKLVKGPANNQWTYNE